MAARQAGCQSLTRTGTFFVPIRFSGFCFMNDSQDWRNAVNDGLTCAVSHPGSLANEEGVSVGCGAGYQ